MPPFLASPPLLSSLLPHSIAAFHPLTPWSACLYGDQSLEPVLGKQVYTAKRVHDWTSAIVESVLNLYKPPTSHSSTWSHVS